MVFGDININFLQNKFEQIREFCKDNLDILLITETKLDISSFPSAQIHIPGYYSPYSLDRSSQEGGILLYIRKYIPSKLLVTGFEGRVEAIFIQIVERESGY